MKKRLFLIFSALLLISFVSGALEVGIDGVIGIDLNTDKTISTSMNISVNFTNFTQLLDTPSSYSGEGENCVAVKSDETGLEFVTCGTGGNGTMDYTNVALINQTNTFQLNQSFSKDINVTNKVYAGDVEVIDFFGRTGRLRNVASTESQEVNNILFSDTTFNVTASGGVVNATIYDRDGGTVIVAFVNYTAYSFLSGKSIELTAGTYTSPQKNYIYIGTNGIVTASTTAPTGDFAWIGIVNVGNVTNNSVQYYAKQDHIPNAIELIKQNYERAWYDKPKYEDESNMQIIMTNTNLSTTQGSFRFALTSVNYGAKNISNGTIYKWISDPNSPYSVHKTLEDFDTYQDNISIGTNKYFNAVIYGLLENNGNNEYYVNIQDDPPVEYTSISDAESDKYEVTNYQCPSEYSKVCFRIARVVLKRVPAGNEIQTLSNGLTYKQLIDEDLIVFGGTSASALGLDEVLSNNPNTDKNIVSTANLTLGQKITFGLGEIIDNIVDGWIQITGNLRTTGILQVDGNIISNGTANFTLQDLNTTGSGGNGTSYNQTCDSGDFLNEILPNGSASCGTPTGGSGYWTENGNTLTYEGDINVTGGDIYVGNASQYNKDSTINFETDWTNDKDNKTVNVTFNSKRVIMEDTTGISAGDMVLIDDLFWSKVDSVDSINNITLVFSNRRPTGTYNMDYGPFNSWSETLTWDASAGKYTTYGRISFNRVGTTGDLPVAYNSPVIDISTDYFSGLGGSGALNLVPLAHNTSVTSVGGYTAGRDYGDQTRDIFGLFFGSYAQTNTGGADTLSIGTKLFSYGGFGVLRAFEANSLQIDHNFILGRDFATGSFQGDQLNGIIIKNAGGSVTSNETAQLRIEKPTQGINKMQIVLEENGTGTGITFGNITGPRIYLEADGNLTVDSDMTYFTGNISVEGIEDRTSYHNESEDGRSLDNIKTIEELFENYEDPHLGLAGGYCENRTDRSRPEIREVYKEICGKVVNQETLDYLKELDENEGIVYDQDIKNLIEGNSSYVCEMKLVNETYYPHEYKHCAYDLSKQLSTVSDAIGQYRKATDILEVDKNLSALTGNIMMANEFVTNTTKDTETFTKIENLRYQLVVRTFNQIVNFVLNEEGRISDPVINYLGLKSLSGLGSYNVEKASHYSLAMIIFLMKENLNQQEQIDMMAEDLCSLGVARWC